MKRILALSLVLALGSNFFSSAQADGDHAAPKGSSRSGPGMAVTAFDPDEGFKMSEQALKTLGIKFAPLGAPSRGSWTISKDSLVRIKHSTGVYRRFQGWISFVLVEVKGKGRDSVVIASEDLQPGDEIAVSGLAYLRMTDADLNSDAVDGHSH